MGYTEVDSVIIVVNFFVPVSVSGHHIGVPGGKSNHRQSGSQLNKLTNK